MTTTPNRRRLNRADTALARLLRARGLSYEAAARELQRRGIQCSASRLAQLARGSTPGPALAWALVRWSGGRLGLRDLVPVEATA